ncbi:alpha/beta fold hydrolase [Sporolactobacillus nakayamae]|uniref:Pimeloyl-ACP methyl ester carboxylesterase n=1 Tax=Sporolactobacillus nakayamae TaxID=269670 RepID=A0A1I2QZC6_9BACL|nr:alpha/beta hydrolase [Sporolactobacillus nakayamae]SFG33652.1 Pimeloyl-ACP methyl ester carboxylesterase [Sporolactobacillus nakayamae]
MWTVRHVVTKNDRVDYKIREEFGDPSASEHVVFIHGQAWTGEVWRMVAKRLQGVHSIAPDMAGCGDSGLSSTYDFTTLSKQLVDVLDQMHVKDIWLVGHSWGASLALHFAAHYSERVKGLMLVDAGYFNYQEWPGISWESFTDFSYPEGFLNSMDHYLDLQKQDTPFWNEDVQRAVVDQIYETEDGSLRLKCLPETELAFSCALWTYHPNEHAAHLKIPISLIVAESHLQENDPITTYKKRSREHFCLLAKQTHCVIMEDASHMVMLERPEELAQEIREMMK